MPAPGPHSHGQLVRPGSGAVGRRQADRRHGVSGTLLCLSMVAFANVVTDGLVFLQRRRGDGKLMRSVA